MKGFRWEERGEGKTLLIGQRGPVALLGFQNYVKVLDPETLLIWFQRPRRPVDPTYPVELLIVKPHELDPLYGDLDFFAFREGQGPIVLGGDPVAHTELATTQVDEDLHAEFPPQLQACEELLILCSSSAIGNEPGWAGDLALLVAMPGESAYKLYPQDWYNHSGTDFGYQWVARVARDAKTGRIHGDGVRIGAFVLDDSLRRVVGGFGPT